MPYATDLQQSLLSYCFSIDGVSFEHHGRGSQRKVYTFLSFNKLEQILRKLKTSLNSRHTLLVGLTRTRIKLRWKSFILHPKLHGHLLLAVRVFSLVQWLFFSFCSF